MSGSYNKRRFPSVCSACGLSFVGWKVSSSYCSRSCSKSHSPRRRKSDVISFEQLVEINNLQDSSEGKTVFLARLIGMAPGTVRRVMRGMNYMWTLDYSHRKVGGTAKRRSDAKILGCLVCTETRAVDMAHLISAADGGDTSPNNVIPLCPTHHRVFDSGLLTEYESSWIEYVCGQRYKAAV